MRVIAVPTRLRWALGLLAMSVLLVTLETLTVTRSLPWRSKALLVLGWTVMASFVYAGVAWCVARGRRWSPSLISAIAGAWLFASTSYAVRMQNYSIAFFTLFLALYWLLVWSWIRLEMRRTFFDPQMAWFQGLPRAIPGVECEIEGVDRYRVSRLDEDGVFVFTPSEERAGALEGWLESRTGSAGLRIAYKDRTVECRGFAVTRLDRGSGAGIQFSGMSPDGRKDLSDFVEALRGEGHV